MEAALASDTPKNELHLHSVMSRAVELDRVLAIYIHQMREQRKEGEV
jgi:hypothetical protein